MFFKEDKINELFKCQKCSQRLTEPGMLLCGNYLCNKCHLFEITEQESRMPNAKLKCCYCEKEHNIPEEGFPISKILEKLLEKERNEIYRSPTIESFK
jgi:hypothetical protein